MNTRLPGPDFGGFRSFHFQLVGDENGRPLLLSNEILELYLGYCARCHLERSEPQSFHGWIQDMPHVGASSDVTPDDNAA